MKQEQKLFEIKEIEELNEICSPVTDYFKEANAEIRRLQEVVKAFMCANTMLAKDTNNMRQQLADTPTWGEWMDADVIPKNIDDSFYEVEFLDSHTELWTMQRINGYYAKILVGKIKEHEIKQYRRLQYTPQPAREVEKTYNLGIGDITAKGMLGHHAYGKGIKELARDLLAAQAELRELKEEK